MEDGRGGIELFVFTNICATHTVLTAPEVDLRVCLQLAVACTQALIKASVQSLLFCVSFSSTWFPMPHCPRRPPEHRRPSACLKHQPHPPPHSHRSPRSTQSSHPPACTVSDPFADATLTNTTCPYRQVAHCLITDRMGGP